jgi:hypothetical protein
MVEQVQLDIGGLSAVRVNGSERKAIATTAQQKIRRVPILSC